MRRVVVIVLEPRTGPGGIFAIIVMALIAGVCIWLFQQVQFVLEGGLNPAPLVYITEGYNPVWLPSGRIIFQSVDSGDYLSIEPDELQPIQATELEIQDSETHGEQARTSCLDPKVTQGIGIFGPLYTKVEGKWSPADDDRTVTWACSPDKRTIVYAANAPSSRLNFYLVGTDGRGKRFLTSVQDWIRVDISWSPDGTSVAIGFIDRATISIYMVKIDR